MWYDKKQSYPILHNWFQPKLAYETVPIESLKIVID